MINKDKLSTMTAEDEALLYSIIYNLIHVADLEKLGVGLRDWIDLFVIEVANDTEQNYNKELRNHANEVLDLSLARYKGQVH
jgi:hypothetical protein